MLSKCHRILGMGGNKLLLRQVLDGILMPLL